MVKFDLEHIKALQQNNATVQKRTFESMYVSMFRVCNRYILQVDEAEDCLMKGFFKLFKDVQHFKWENDTGFYWWCRRIMVNECLMTLRKNKNFLMALEEEIHDVMISAEVWEQLDAEHLNELIKSLPTGYRTVFTLYTIDGFSHQEIATLLGISENTSKTQLAKAKLKLKTMVEPQHKAYGC